MNIPVLTADQAKHFGGVWKHNGIHIFMDNSHYQFAADFANVVLKSFIEQAQREAAEAAKPKVVLVQ